MTVGIYKLVFSDTDKVYIGKSTNIEERYKTHLYLLRNNKGYAKLQEAYKKHGAPIIEILLECPTNELNSAEIEAIDIWDSYSKGFNSTLGGDDPPIFIGRSNYNSIYSEEQIIEVFNILSNDTSFLYKDIQEITGVSISTITSIKTGLTHVKLLQEAFPDTYLTVVSTSRKNLNNNAKSIGITYPEVLSPLGEKLQIDNLRQFCIKYNLDTRNMAKLLKGEAKSCKKWTLA